jgi:phosphatidylinositol alpha-1,6-mannosyltransferase
VTRAIVLTPQMQGADGVSAVTRELVAALEPLVGITLGSLEVWSLDDTAAPEYLGVGTRFRTAAGSRLTFASFGLRAGAAAAETLLIVLHAHLLPVTLPMARRGTRVAAFLLGIEAWKPLRPLERAALRRAWRIASISQHTVDRFRAANPDLANLAVHVCHPGIGAAAARTGGHFTENMNPLNPLNRMNPVNPLNPANEILIVGRMSSRERYKGHDALLDVWARVRAQAPGATLVIAGGGDDRPRLVSRVAELGLADCVRFEGVVSAVRLETLYRQAAVFAMPSSNEGFGLVFVEAMRAGTPCVAVRGAAEEIIDDGVTGEIVAPDDDDALARALVRLLVDPVRRQRMGAAARAAASRFDSAGFAGRLHALLDLAPQQPGVLSATDAAC